MANITKRISRHIGGTQYWDTSTDTNDSASTIVAGDIFRIETSLGKPGRKMSIITGSGSISIRINAMQALYPTRSSTEFFNADLYKNLALAGEYKDTSQTPIVIPATQTWEWNGEMPINNIEIVTLGANFKLIVS